jgi:putative ABC transport system permease protein
MIRLVFAYLGERQLTVALNVLLLAISVGMLVVLLQFSRQAEERFLDGAENIDLVVGAKGSPLQLVLSSVYHLDQPTGNIPLGALEDLRANPMVASAIPLALGDNFRGFRIVGTEPALIDLYAAELARGRNFACGLEVVVGADMAAATGARLGQRFIGSHGLAADEGEQGHEATPFVVVGILAPTGKPIDRLILTSVESVWDVHGIEHPAGEHARGGHDHDSAAGEREDRGSAAEITAILLGYRSPAAAVRLPAMIDRNTAMQSASPARESARLITLFQPAIEALGLFALLLGGAGAFAVFVTLWSAVRGREGDLALLRVMGASRATIFGTVLLEGAIVALMAALIGLGFAHGLLWLASRSFPSVAEAGIVPFAFHADEAAIVAGAVLLGMAAALLPAWNVTRNNLAPILDRN